MVLIERDDGDPCASGKRKDAGGHRGSKPTVATERQGTS
jgi:hypothetical protein